MDQSTPASQSDAKSSTEPISGRYTGSCLCGTISYTLSSPPKSSVLCHCKNCKKASGSSFAANDWHALSDLTINSGSSTLKTYIDDSLNSTGNIQRQFCGKCGSPMFIQSPKYPGFLTVTSGTRNELDEMKKNWTPKQQYFCNRRMEWLPEVEGSETFDAMT